MGRSAFCKRAIQSGLGIARRQAFERFSRRKGNTLMVAKFDFYEVVSVGDSSALPSQLWGEEGVVLGRSQNQEGGWEYAVQIFADNDECWQLEETVLNTTGRKMKRSDLYNGDSIRIIVDPKNGTGSEKK